MWLFAIFVCIVFLVTYPEGFFITVLPFIAMVVINVWQDKRRINQFKKEGRL